MRHPRAPTARHAPGLMQPQRTTAVRIRPPAAALLIVALHHFVGVLASSAAVGYVSQMGSLSPGSDLHSANFSSEAAARSWCTAHPLCQGYTFQNGTVLAPPPPRTTACFFRAHVNNISACANSTSLAVFTRHRDTWSFHRNKTCQPGAGATIPRGPYGPNGPYGTWGRWDARSGEWAGNATLGQCMVACERDSACSAIVVALPDLPPPPPPSPPLAAQYEEHVTVWPTMVYFKLGVIGVIHDNRWTAVIKTSTVSMLNATTPLGTLRGTRASVAGAGGKTASYDQFLGVRYVEPMSAATRWRHATPKRPWVGVVDALRVGSACPSQSQPPNVHPQKGSAWWPERPYHEDCLFLNIYSPSVSPADGKLLPVFFWIHGGSFIGGTGNGFNGTEIASTLRTMVVVCINYRLGIFGYMGAHELRSRTADGSTGNYGQDDQRQAMKWVQQNIHAFGGDKDRVIIMGQSSGAGSVSTHLVTPQSFGLYHYAAMASGPFGTWIPQSFVALPPKVSTDGSQATFDDIANETNCRPKGAAAADARRRRRLAGGDGAESTAIAMAAVDELTVACLERIPTDVLVTLNATKAASCESGVSLPTCLPVRYTL